MADFSNIKVGDKIKYYPRFWGDFPHVATVTKVTPNNSKIARMLDFANLMVGALVAVTLIVRLRQKKILPSLTDVISEKKC